MKADPQKLRIAAALGFLAVALGAMGAHGLEAMWKAQLPLEEAVYRLKVWNTASFYHSIHAVVLLILAYAFPTPTEGRWTVNTFFAGILVFSGSLYLLSYTGMKWLGAITPIGGLLLMCGWLFLVLNARPKIKA